MIARHSPPELVRDVYRLAADGMPTSKIAKELRSSFVVVKRILAGETIVRTWLFCGPLRRCPECGRRVVCHCVDCIVAGRHGFADLPPVSVRYWRDPRARVRMGHAVYRSLDGSEIYVQFCGRVHGSLSDYGHWVPAALVQFERSINSRNCF